MVRFQDQLVGPSTRLPMCWRLAIALTVVLLPLSRSWAQNEGASQEQRLKQILKRFPQADANKDGKLTLEEARAFRAKMRAGQGGSNQPKPTHADVAYGKHDKQKFDLWLAKPKDDQPTPLVIFIHGGGFRGGDKRSVKGSAKAFLDEGISFASMNYRLTNEGPFPMPMHDAARGLQFIRAHAKKWNIDPKKIACYGGSAGAGISLWLAFHDDLAKPGSEDEIERQSTRIIAAGSMNGQSTYDMKTFRDWFEIPNLKPHPALEAFYGVEKEDDWKSERVQKLMKEASPITHLTKDDPPVFMAFGKGDVPVKEDSNPGLWVHHAKLGVKLKEAMEKMGLECQVKSPDHREAKYGSIEKFLIMKLNGK